MIFKSFLWKFLERTSTQVISFFTMIILSRILSPSEVGIVAVILVFTTISNVLIQGGLGTALIQKKNVKNIDYSNVFFFNISLAILLYILLFTFSDYLSIWFDFPQFDLYLKTIGLNLFAYAFSTIQNVKVIREYKFKLLMKINLIATTISSVTAIIMAYLGFGVWALVVQQVVSTYLSTILLLICIKTKIKFGFSFEKFKILYSYGWKIMFSSLLNNLYNELPSLIIGNRYTPEDNGFFTRGKQFPGLLIGVLDNSLQTIMLPMLSEKQNNINQVKEIYRSTVKKIGWVFFPFSGLLFVCSDQIIVLLLSDKWIESSEYLKMFSVFFAIQPILNANNQLFNSLGKSGLTLKLEIYKKILGITLLVVFSYFNLKLLVFGLILTSIISFLVNLYVNQKVIKCSVKDGIRDIIPQVLVNSIITLICTLINYEMDLQPIFMLILLSSLYLFIYVLFIVLFDSKLNINFKSDLKKIGVFK